MEHFITLRGLSAWGDFWSANGHAIDKTSSEALCRARDGGLRIGGGAAPTFVVIFVEE